MKRQIVEVTESSAGQRPLGHAIGQKTSWPAILLALITLVALVACGTAPAPSGAMVIDGGMSSNTPLLDGAVLSGVITVSVKTNGASTESVRFYLDTRSSDEPTAVDSEAPFEFVVDTSALADGPHYLMALAVSRGAKGRTEQVLESTFTVDNGEVNQPPSVDAGPNRTAVVGEKIELIGAVSDDGKPAGTLSVAWSTASGPAEVAFTNPVDDATGVTFATAGMYVIELFATDGLASGQDLVEVDVTEPGTQSPDPYPEPAPTPADSACLDDATNVIELEGVFTREYHNRDGQPAGTAIDARAASFEARFDSSEDDPVTLMNIPYLCWSGGRIDNQIPDDTDDWSIYHSSQGIYISSSPGFVIEGVTIGGVGDGIRIQEDSDNFTIRGSYFRHTGDDAIENDIVQSGVIEDNLFDWAYVYYSARLASKDEGAHDGSGNIVVMDSNLVALRPQNATYSGTSPGHGGFFKMDNAGASPRLVLRNNVFLATQEPNHTGLDLTAEGAVVESTNNTIVWLGEGDFPEDVPPGWTLTRDIRVWEEARAKWLERHPEIVPGKD